MPGDPTEPPPPRLLGGAMLALPLWAVLWLGLNADPWNPRVLGPLGVLAASAALLYRVRARAAPPPLPLLLLGGYAAVGLVGGVLVSPSKGVAAYWALAFLAVPAMVWALALQGEARASARHLLDLNWLACAALTVLFLAVAAWKLGLVESLLALTPNRFYGSRPEVLGPLFAIQANGVGRYAALAALVGLARWAFPGRGRRRTLWLALALLALVMLVFSVSRSSILGFGAAALALALLRLGWRRVALGAGVLVVGLAATGALVALVAFLQRGQSLEMLLSFSNRAWVWWEALGLLAQSPLFGWGFHADRLLIAGEHVHNGWIHAFLQAGLVGGALFAGAWLAAARSLRDLGLRRRFTGLAEGDRAGAVEATVALVFLGVRSLTESTGGFFGVDLLLLVPLFAYVEALRAQHPAAAPSSAASPAPALPPRARPRVLVGAFAAVPPGREGFTGGEDVLGWHFARQLTRFYDVWMLTLPENREGIEAELRARPNPRLHVAYVALPLPRPHPQRFGGIQAYSYLWQLEAYAAARALHEEVGFDLYHHLTYGSDWMASHAGALLPIPYLRGPGAGAHRTPPAFARRRGARYRAVEATRMVLQGILRLDPFFLLGRGRASALLVCNREAMRKLPRRAAAKARYFPCNGFDPSDLDLDVPKRADDRLRVVVAGKLLPIKGVDLALRAVAGAMAQGLEAELRVVGDGPERARLEALARELGIADRVAFLGWRPHREVLVEMAQADVFLFPGMREGGGAVIVEAMALGVPVVCLATGGPALHVTPSTGIAIPPTDPDDAVARMAEAIVQLRRDPALRNRLGAAARRRALQVYAWDRLGDRLRILVGEAMGARAALQGAPAPVEPPTFRVLGTRLSAVDLPGALAFLDAAIAARRRTFVGVCTVNNVMTARRDPELHAAHEAAGMNLCDGAPLARLARRRSPWPSARVRGPDFTRASCALAAERGWRCFLYGGGPGVAERMAEALRERHPGLQVVGTYAPPFRPLTPEEDAEVVARINASRPDLVWVGLSTPKQEKWMLAHRDRLEAPVLVGVGAAFDFIAGRVREAPPAVRESGFEFMWRFAQEPRRLWRRVLVQGPAFVALAAMESLRLWLSRGPRAPKVREDGGADPFASRAS